MVATYLKDALVTLSTIVNRLPHLDALKTGLKLAPQGNLWLQFGVYKGSTLKKIAAATNNTVYGFDSFLGLPETWRQSKDSSFDQRYTIKGSFSLRGNLPKLHAANARLIKGWFNDTLPGFLKKRQTTSISMLHIDCDLYSSTAYILTTLKTHIRVGTVIVFDELINYPSFEEHEFRALSEWLNDTGHFLKVLSGAHMVNQPLKELHPQSVAFQVVDKNDIDASDTFHISRQNFGNDL